MLTVANIVITLLLWALLFFAIYYVRRNSRVVLPEDSYLKEKATTNSALDLSALQEETISLARDLNEMLIDIGHFPLTMAFSSVIINGVFERSEEEKHAIEAHRIKLVHRFYVFDGRLGDLQQSYGELGIARQSLDQFRGNTTSDEIRELIKTLYELAVLIDEGYPRKSL